MSLVSPIGAKSWRLIYTAPGSDQAPRLALGTYPATGLAGARTRAMEARSKIEQGEDPRPAKRGQAPAAGTVAELVESYLRKHGDKLKSGADLTRRLRRDVVPVIGDVKLEALHRRDVHRVLDAIKDRGAPQSAAKRHADLRAMFRWALNRGDLDHDPLAGAKAPAASRPRERFLDADEIRTLWPALAAELPAPIALALKLSLTTGQRIGEILGVEESELDIKKRIWRIPAERAKNGHEHTVPLSRLALDLVAEARASGFFSFSTLHLSQGLGAAAPSASCPGMERPRLEANMRHSPCNSRRVSCRHWRLLKPPIDHQGDSDANALRPTYIRPRMSRGVGPMGRPS